MKREKSPAEILYDTVVKLNRTIAGLERSGSVSAYAEENWTAEERRRFAGQLDRTAANLTAISHDLKAGSEGTDIARDWVC